MEKELNIEELKKIIEIYKFEIYKKNITINQLKYKLNKLLSKL
jgi:hypothetical protein